MQAAAHSKPRYAGALDDVVWPTGTTALPALTSLSGDIASQTRNWLAERTHTQP